MTDRSSTFKHRSLRNWVSAGLLGAISLCMASAPALAEGKHGRGAHDNGGHSAQYQLRERHREEYRYREEVRYYGEPEVIYVERVYVKPRPVHVTPRPSINIIVPLFD